MLTRSADFFVEKRRNVRAFQLAVLSSALSCVALAILPVNADPSGSDKAKETASKVASSAKAALASKAARPRVLDFGAVWCGPCKKFAPIFDKVAKNYKGKVEFVHYDFENGEGKTLADKYKVTALPTIIFMDAKGKIALKYESGAMKEAELIKHTEDLLK